MLFAQDKLRAAEATPKAGTRTRWSEESSI